MSSQNCSHHSPLVCSGMKQLKLPKNKKIKKKKGERQFRAQKMVLKETLTSHCGSKSCRLEVPAAQRGRTQRKHATVAVVSNPVPNQPQLTINENDGWEYTSLRCRMTLIFPGLLTFDQNPKAPFPLFMEVFWIYGRSGAIAALSQ